MLLNSLRIPDIAFFFSDSMTTLEGQVVLGRENSLFCPVQPRRLPSVAMTQIDLSSARWIRALPNSG